MALKTRLFGTSVKGEALRSIVTLLGHDPNKVQARLLKDGLHLMQQEDAE